MKWKFILKHFSFGGKKVTQCVEKISGTLQIKLVFNKNNITGELIYLPNF